MFGADLLSIIRSINTVFTAIDIDIVEFFTEIKLRNIASCWLLLQGRTLTCFWYVLLPPYCGVTACRVHLANTRIKLLSLKKSYNNRSFEFFRAEC